MTYQPLVSIVIPTLNADRYLSQTLESLKNQTYPKIEIVVIDGCSTDDTHSILERYTSIISRVIISKDKGMYDALNKGFRESSGEILCYLNSDDLFYSQTITTVVNIFKSLPQDQPLIIYGNLDLISDTGVSIKTHRYPSFDRKLFLYAGHSLIGQPASFWNRSLHKTFDPPFNSELNYAGDYEFYVKASLLAKVIHVNHNLACFRVHSQSMSKLHRVKHMTEHRLVQEKYKSEISVLDRFVITCKLVLYHFINKSSLLFASIVDNKIKV